LVVPYLSLTGLCFLVFFFHKSVPTRKLLISTSAVLMALVLYLFMVKSLGFRLDYARVINKHLMIGADLLITAISIPLSYYFLYGFFARRYTTWKKRLSFPAPLTRATLALGLLPILVSLAGFVLENTHHGLEHRSGSSTTQKGVNVILIVIDTLRADHLGCYGYPRNTSPQLDALAAQGVLFKNFYTQSSWTKPSVASLFTSLYPPTHRANSHGDALPGEALTLAEVLREHGFLNYACVGNGIVKRLFNYDQGFHAYDDNAVIERLYCAVLRIMRHRIPYASLVISNSFFLSYLGDARLINRSALPWLEQHRGERFFAYLHYLDPHGPYAPPPPYARTFPYNEELPYARDLALYDGEIRYADAKLGDLFERLRELAIYDDTLIVITSDHGEAFGEHGDAGHGASIFQDQLRVPLIIKFPGAKISGRRLTQVARSIDIMPTILDYLGIDIPPDLEGASLLPLLEPSASPAPTAEVYADQARDRIDEMWGVIIDNRWKYIFTENSRLKHTRVTGKEQLYDLSTDPGELENLIESMPLLAKQLSAKSTQYKQRSSAKAFLTQKVKIDKGTVQMMKALGYLQ